MKHHNFIGVPLAILPAALDQVEQLLSAGPSAAGPRAASAPIAVPSGVALISMDGPILTDVPDWLREYIRAVDANEIAAAVNAAANDPNVTGIVLYTNSPGGTVSGGVPAAAEAVRQAAKSKPVIAYAPDMAASAAYWVISGATSILTSSVGLIGSIGTYVRWTDQSKLAADMGLQVYVYRSAPGKAPGQPGEPHNEHLDAALTDMVDSANAVFIAGVAAGRGLSIEAVTSRLATGAVWVGEGAVAAGVADQIGTLADAVRLAGGNSPPQNAARPAGGQASSRASVLADAQSTKGVKMNETQLRLLGLSAEATPEQIEAALKAGQSAVAAQNISVKAMTSALGLEAGTALPDAPMSALSTQAADGRAARTGALDRLHALTITTEGNDPDGISAADDARELYQFQPLERVHAQIKRLEAKRDSLPVGPLSKQPSEKPATAAPVNRQQFGLPRR